MAAALAQNSLDAAAEFLELLIRHEGLNGARKAAAVHAACAVAAQQMLGKRQRERNLLMGRAALGDHILQIHPRRIAGFLDVLKEGGEIVVFECTQLQTNALVVLIDMDRAQHGAVPCRLPHLAD